MKVSARPRFITEHSKLIQQVVTPDSRRGNITIDWKTQHRIVYSSQVRGSYVI